MTAVPWTELADLVGGERVLVADLGRVDGVPVQAIHGPPFPTSAPTRCVVYSRTDAARTPVGSCVLAAVADPDARAEDIRGAAAVVLGVLAAAGYRAAGYAPAPQLEEAAPD
ncbi:hypothetical protein [Allonocardiopsis opalescens]|uniref:Uncharacterized protein n=1 Tax=Allonocardiopsis opalescens TaxID=1144618 RepID=A0A2T0PPM2_9ACTN|nr:hypothetical protein [Allonocardiopsis opalescens]PRX90850.1 hypothetical protein CLV72_11646 [Allonocardiopsis opalescens]